MLGHREQRIESIHVDYCMSSVALLVEFTCIDERVVEDKVRSFIQC